MSVDFYVAVPAVEWPSLASVQQCMGKSEFPVTIERFPKLKPGQTSNDGALVVVDGTKAYLEGTLSPSDVVPDEVAKINGRLSEAQQSFRISREHALMSVHARSNAEVRAASYVISGLIICFSGYGFEPQGNGHGREDFVKGLLAVEQQLRNQD